MPKILISFWCSPTPLLSLRRWFQWTWIKSEISISVTINNEQLRLNALFCVIASLLRQQLMSTSVPSDQFSMRYYCLRRPFGFQLGQWVKPPFDLIKKTFTPAGTLAGSPSFCRAQKDQRGLLHAVLVTSFQDTPPAIVWESRLINCLWNYPTSLA